MSNTYQQLGAEERGIVMAMKVQHCSARTIAAVLGRSPSTITRELRRNGYESEEEQCVMGRPRVAGGSGAARAGKRARVRARAPAPCGLADAQTAPRRCLVAAGQDPSAAQALARADRCQTQATPSWTGSIASLSRDHLHRHLCDAQGRLAPVTGGITAPGGAVPASPAPAARIGVDRCRTSRASTCVRARPTTDCRRGIGKAISSRAGERIGCGHAGLPQIVVRHAGQA